MRYTQLERPPNTVVVPMLSKQIFHKLGIYESTIPKSWNRDHPVSKWEIKPGDTIQCGDIVGTTPGGHAEGTNVFAPVSGTIFSTGRHRLDPESEFFVGAEFWRAPIVEIIVESTKDLDGDQLTREAFDAVNRRFFMSMFGKMANFPKVWWT